MVIQQLKGSQQFKFKMLWKI